MLEPASTTNAEFEGILQVLKDSSPLDETKYIRWAPRGTGASGETTTSVHRLRGMVAKGVLFPVSDVNDCGTTAKSDNAYGCRHSLPDSIMRARGVMIGGKRILVCSGGDVGKGCAFALRGASARKLVTEIDPFNAL